MTIEQAEKNYDERVFDLLAYHDEATVDQLAKLTGRLAETTRRSVERLLAQGAVEVFTWPMGAWRSREPGKVEGHTKVRRAK